MPYRDGIADGERAEDVDEDKSAISEVCTANTSVELAAGEGVPEPGRFLCVRLRMSGKGVNGSLATGTPSNVFDRIENTPI